MHDIKCRGLRWRCTCKVYLEALVREQFSSLRDVHEGKQKQLDFSFLAEN